ncbi:phasin family protein [Aurantimonas sp. LRZ36]|uniref:Phasin family protein n=2 Tax=Aurantimonas marianensis TaxID=2920428 RepID=A0A9X2H2U4_9HYPH|nr:phasin family protein [Aurantimonas marianensis]MCP3054615.1 phasin family protein [Aurantimonas marianensis]
MMNVYEDASKITQEALDNAMKSASVVTKGFQQIAAETTDFTKRAYEQQAEMLEKLFRTKTLDKGIELQADYAKTAYQSWVSQATRMGEIYADLAKQAYKPFEQTALTATDAGSRAAKQVSQSAEKKAAA